MASKTTALRLAPSVGVRIEPTLLYLPGRRVTARTELDARDRVVQVDAALRPIAIVLPAANTLPFRTFFVLKVDASTNAVTVSARGGGLVNGGGSLILGGPFDGACFWSDGSAWYTLPGVGGVGPPGPPGPAGPAGAPHEEDPAGTRPGTVFTLSGAPSVLFLRHNTMTLIKAGALTDINQYTLTGNVITTFDTILAGDDFHAIWF